MFPYNHFYPVIGTDNALIFDKWKDYKKILKNYIIDVY
jgi:nicotinic acid mononucleotide adenylyltransferase